MSKNISMVFMLFLTSCLMAMGMLVGGTGASAFAATPRRIPVVCIDPGHASSSDLTRVRVSPYSRLTQIRETGGTSGRKSGSEQAVNMYVAKRLAQDLRAKGVRVAMTKTKNSKKMSNRARAEVANKCKADLEVRIHCDSAGSRTHGFLTCVPGRAGYQGKKARYKKSQRAGRYLHKRICKSLGAKSRGVSTRTDLAGFNWCKRPTVLFEIGNMANAHDDRLLAKKSYKKKVARSIAKATLAWLRKGA